MLRMADGIAAVAALWLLVVASLGHLLDSWCGAAVCREAALRSKVAVRCRVTTWFLFVRCGVTQVLALWCCIKCRGQVMVIAQPLHLGGSRAEIWTGELLVGFLGKVGIVGV